MVRNSLKFVPYKDRKAVAADLNGYTFPPPKTQLARCFRHSPKSGIRSIH
jgi:transposase-like protein